MIGEIKSLHPAFKMKVDQILHGMHAKGWDAVIGSGMRSLEQQAALFAQGRESLDNVNTLRKKAGLSAISMAENSHVVTHARPGTSNHNLTTALLASSRSTFEVVNGYAVDIVSRVHGWNPPRKKFWEDLGAIARKYGCEWGGDWKGDRYDPAHVQLKIIDSAPRRSAVA
jgi:peptidoglycan LD-endopeptidase CwlK